MQCLVAAAGKLMLPWQTAAARPALPASLGRDAPDVHRVLTGFIGFLDFLVRDPPACQARQRLPASPPRQAHAVERSANCHASRQHCRCRVWQAPGRQSEAEHQNTESGAEQATRPPGASQLSPGTFHAAGHRGESWRPPSEQQPTAWSVDRAAVSVWVRNAGLNVSERGRPEPTRGTGPRTLQM
jgi:hypothetical protein